MANLIRRGQGLVLRVLLREIDNDRCCVQNREIVDGKQSALVYIHGLMQGETAAQGENNVFVPNRCSDIHLRGFARENQENKKTMKIRTQIYCKQNKSWLEHFAVFAVFAILTFSRLLHPFVG